MLTIKILLRGIAVGLFLWMGLLSAYGAECNLRLVRDFERINELLPVTVKKAVAYDRLRARLSNDLQSCPNISFPIKEWGLGSLTELDFAILAQDVNKVRQLVTLKHVQDRRDSAGQTAMHFAARYGNATIITLLVEAGFNPNARDNFGNTPLMAAAGGVEREAENVKALVKSGAKVNYVASNRFTPLVQAILSQDIPAVRYILTQRLDRTIYQTAISPGQTAEKVGNETIIRMLKAHGF